MKLPVALSKDQWLGERTCGMMIDLSTEPKKGGRSPPRSPSTIDNFYEIHLIQVLLDALQKLDIETVGTMRTFLAKCTAVVLAIERDQLSDDIQQASVDLQSQTSEHVDHLVLTVE
jgi:hypothetical protein